MTQGDWQKVWAVVESASALPAEQHERFVESSLHDDLLRRTALELLSESDEDEPEMTGPGRLPAEEPSAAEWQLIGTSLGRFEIVAPIGRGGMGEVYRGFDPELDRFVAIKCIAGRRLGTSSSVANFLREARMASALNHPGIVTVHEVIRTRDTVAIVMELAEGDNLRKFCEAPQPVSRVVAWGQQIAEALAAAHAAGLIHRDIKPENLVLRKDGLIKILDFGLARRHQETPEPASVEVAGTLRYMSPEQARGAGVTPATDVFSLGIVLYELTAGVHPFASAGKSNTTLSVAAAVAAQPLRPASTIVPSLPRALDTLLTRMLDKDPAQRPAADAVAAELRALPHANLRRRRVLLGVVLATCAALAAFGVRSTWFGTPSKPVEVHGTLLTGSPGRESTPAFSPDDRSVIYAWDGGHGGKRDIWIKRLDSADPQQVTSTPEDETDPCWLPDGSAVAFLRAGPSSSYQVVIASPGGGPERIVTTTTVSGHWMQHRLACKAGGEVVVADERPPLRDLQLVVVSTATGERRALSDTPLEMSDYWPRISPDGRRIAFVRAGDGFEVRVMDLNGGPSRSLIKVAELKGLDWAPGGKSLLYQVGAAEPRNIWEVPVSGGTPHRPAFLTENDAGELAVSHDGHKIAYSRGIHNINLWRVFTGGRPAEKLAPSTRSEQDGAWSPDGARFAFVSDRSVPGEIWVASASGRNVRRLANMAHCGSPAWSPDGKWLAFDMSNGGPVRVGVVSAEGGDARLIGPDGSFVPSWSKDGKWIYFCYRIGTAYQIFKMPSTGGAPVQVTPGEGFESRESPDGRFLYFSRATANGIWRLPLSGENAGVEEKVADFEFASQFRCWDLTTQGLYLASPGLKPQVDLLPFGGVRKQVATLPTELPKSGRCLSVHPDGQSVLFPIVEPDRWEIYVADIPAGK